MAAAISVWSPAAADTPGPATISAAFQSVVSVLPQWQGRPQNLEEPEGSGVVVGDGTAILTADHVLGNAETVLVRTAAGMVVAAEIARRDTATDLALLVVAERLQPLDFAVEYSTGDEVCALGNAFGLGLSVACGTISATERSGMGFNRIEDFVQTDAAINPGMSGGALIAADGRLVGLLSAIFTKQADANIGVNFAASAALLQAALARFARPGPVRWPSLGATFRPSPGRGEVGPVGAQTLEITTDSPAALAGLRRGDIVVAAGGRPVDRPDDIAAALALASAPALALTVFRAGARLDLAVPVAE